MKVLVVDDEPLARERMIALLADIEFVQPVGSAGNGREALEKVTQAQPDVILLDIRMPVMDGLEAARHLALLDPPPGIIFCTAYEDHALDAFEANAIDYLLKPVRVERLHAALLKAQRWSATHHLRPIEPERRRSHLCARVRGDLVLVPLNDIHYLLAEDRYVVVHHARGEVLVEESLTALEEEFGDHFLRIHRNCLVAQSRLSGLTRSADGRLFARLDGIEAQLEISRRNLPAVRKRVRSM